MERYIPDFLVLCLAVFFSTNVYNIYVVGRLRSWSEPYAEIERPTGVLFVMAALGTFAYFIETIIFLVLFYSSGESVFSQLPGSISLPQPFVLQVAGAVSTGMGFALFIWSVSTRGEYSVSWAMRPDHQLVTTGPYRYVRHPSYLGYFLMFLGLPLIWNSFVSLIPIVAVPGYYVITFTEEELLVKRFGQQYSDYQKKTGRLLPRLRR